MKIIIDNREFSYDIGCRILKLKHEECPDHLPSLKDFWDDIIPYTFKEIVSSNLKNVEDRRVAIKYLGVERLYKEVNSILINEETIKKTTSWINSEGVLETVSYDDTYSLYMVRGNLWTEGATNVFRSARDVYFVKCKDASTDREYFLWVDPNSVLETNDINIWRTNKNIDDCITAIQAIAWTIQTNIKKGGIEKIVRQGDCILVKKKENSETGMVRHLTEKEYRELITSES